MIRFVVAAALCVSLAACSILKPEPAPAYVVFFIGKSVELTPDAQKIISKAAAKAKRMRPQMVQIAGPGTHIVKGYDPSFAGPRMDAVANALVADGVDKALLVRTSLTTGAADVDLSGASRVEIRLVPKTN
ncbi:MAG TPA: hypothetical protein VFI93_07890 [Rhizomicrobium sp.]|jgi:hypothetical protein|nr:hypothetical protein [Rhizomicrobium sp.]